MESVDPSNTDSGGRWDVGIDVPLPLLLANLRARDIQYLRGPSDPGADQVATRAPLPALPLFRALATADEPRVREAIISLLLLHPELAADLLAGIHAARADGEDAIAEMLATRALATLYLQSLWHPALTLALGHPPGVPAHLFTAEWRARALPPPREDVSAAGLRQLAHKLGRPREMMGVSVNLLGDWHNQLHHLMHQAWTHRLAAQGQRQVTGLSDGSTPSTPRDAITTNTTLPARLTQVLLPSSAASTGAKPSGDAAAASRVPSWAQELEEPESAGKAVAQHGGSSRSWAMGGEEGEPLMSFRPDVSRAEIERFLQVLGQGVHQSGRLYLVGGAALVHAQVRGQGATTEDIDVVLAVPDEHQVQTTIRRLITQLGVNVELAGPGDFIPLPASWEAASRYVGRYGALEVFYFDFTSLALAKVERFTSRDVRDIDLLAQHGLIDRVGLEAAYREIRPRLGQGRFFNVDPTQFDQKMQSIIQRLWGSSTP